MTRVILKDLKKREFLFSIEFEQSDGPFNIAMDAAYSYFNRHFAAFADGPPRNFALFFRNHQVVARVDCKLVVGEDKIVRHVIGDPHRGSEETSPYTFERKRPPQEIDPEKFPKFGIPFSLSPPGVKNFDALMHRKGFPFVVE